MAIVNIEVEQACSRTLESNGVARGGDAADTAANSQATNDMFGTSYDKKGRAWGTDTQMNASNKSIDESRSAAAKEKAAQEARNTIDYDLVDPVDAFLESQYQAELATMRDVAQNIGLSNVTSWDVNYKTGITTVGHEASLFGMGLGFDVDTHYNEHGELGFGDELAADVLEVLTIEVTQLNVDILGGIASLALGMFTGAPLAAKALSSLSLASNVALANDMISEQQNRNLQATTMFLGLGLTAVSFMQQTQALASMSKYMTTSGKLMAATITALQGYGIYSQFYEIANMYGIDVSTISHSDIQSWDISSDNNSGDGILGQPTYNATEMYHDFMKWYVVSKVSMLNPGEQLDADDIFKKMAGGLLYNAMFPGGMYWHPLNTSSNTRASVMKDENVEESAKLLIMGGSDYFFSKNQMVNSGTDQRLGTEEAVSNAKRARVNQISKLQDQVNSLIDKYEGRVSQYNNMGITGKTQAAYDKATAELSSINVNIETLNTQIQEIASKI